MWIRISGGRVSIGGWNGFSLASTTSASSRVRIEETEGESWRDRRLGGEHWAARVGGEVEGRVSRSSSLAVSTSEAGNCAGGGCPVFRKQEVEALVLRAGAGRGGSGWSPSGR